MTNYNENPQIALATAYDNQLPIEVQEMDNPCGPQCGEGAAPAIDAEPLGTGAMMKPPTALDTQVGGEHYKDLKIQPMEIAHANKLVPWEYDALKYLLRWRTKGGKEDLHKCHHCISLGIQLEFGGKESA